MKVHYEQSWKRVLRSQDEEINYWIQREQIPIGTDRPPYEYSGEIPEEEVVTIPFKNINIDFSERKADNILILAGSGDGKSLQIKNQWWFLKEAGCYVVYVDCKNTQSGYAKLPWFNNRLAPHTKPKGIKLKHYIPSHRAKKDRFLHNFKIYSMKLKELNDFIIWTCLGQTIIASSKLKSIIINKDRVNMQLLKNELKKRYIAKEMNRQAYDSAVGKLISMEELNVTNNEYNSIPLVDNLTEGYSVCISLQCGSDYYTTTDIGEKISRLHNWSVESGNRVPIYFIIDDASLITNPEKVKPEINLAIQEIKNIGYNYRSDGVYNILAVQSLSIIDDSVAESYPIKLISPEFANPDSLAKIGINKEIISLLKSGELKKDEKNMTMPWIISYSKTAYKVYYPFLPPCNHFKNVYLPQEVQNANI